MSESSVSLPSQVALTSQDDARIAAHLKASNHFTNPINHPDAEDNITSFRKYKHDITYENLTEVMQDEEKKAILLFIQAAVQRCLKWKDSLVLDEKFKLFNKHVEADILTLFRSRYIDVLLIQSLTFYDDKLQGWIIPVFPDKQEVVLKANVEKAFGFKMVDYDKFVSAETIPHLGLNKETLSSDKFWKENPMMLSIISALTMFDPEEHTLKNTTMFKEFRRVMKKLLGKYLTLDNINETLETTKLLRSISGAIDTELSQQCKGYEYLENFMKNLSVKK